MKETTLHADPCPPSTVLCTAFREIQGIHLLTILTESEWELRPSFSITVLAFDNTGVMTDACTVRDITSLQPKANRIFRCISDGLVTPCTLADILSDTL